MSLLRCGCILALNSRSVVLLRGNRSQGRSTKEVYIVF